MPHSIQKDEEKTRNCVPFWSADNIANTKEIPTYLFRLTAPATDGTTTVTNVCPPAPRNENFLDLPSCDAANHLYQHLRPVYGHQDSCNFMSWSSSLSFLIQYAFYRSRTWWKDQNFNDIKLLVIDTRNLPKGIFAKDMDLLEFLDSTCDCIYHEKLKYFAGLRKGDYYFGEYLTQGNLDLLDGDCVQVSFGKMVNLGLFNLLPDILKDEQHWENWAKPVKSSRIPFFLNNDAGPTSEYEVDAAISIAKTLFRSPWSLPVATMLLGLKPRQRNDPIIISGFIEHYGVETIRDIMSQGLIIDGEKLPEVNEYGYIFSEIVLSVLKIDELKPSDSNDSVDNEFTAVADLASDLSKRLTLN